jgi:hypothetical protein
MLKPAGWAEKPAVDFTNTTPNPDKRDSLWYPLEGCLFQYPDRLKAECKKDHKAGVSLQVKFMKRLRLFLFFWKYFGASLLARHARSGCKDRKGGLYNTGC